MAGDRSAPVAGPGLFGQSDLTFLNGRKQTIDGALSDVAGDGAVGVSRRRTATDKHALSRSGFPGAGGFWPDAAGYQLGDAGRDLRVLWRPWNDAPVQGDSNPTSLPLPLWIWRVSRFARARLRAAATARSTTLYLSRRRCSLRQYRSLLRALVRPARNLHAGFRRHSAALRRPSHRPA